MFSSLILLSTPIALSLLFSRHAVRATERAYADEAQEARRYCLFSPCARRAAMFFSSARLLLRRYYY